MPLTVAPAVGPTEAPAVAAVVVVRTDNGGVEMQATYR